jgi:mannose-6-phosphate isomerase-like protein (cupin superfamily)
VQLNQNQPRRLYEGADLTYYVISGEGTLRVDGRETAIGPSSFISVPRGTGYELLGRGRRSLVLLMELNGEPCEEASRGTRGRGN